MGYQESFLYIEPQWKFEKLIRTYEKAEQAGYYRVAGAEPRSVVVLKQPLGSIPQGRRPVLTLLWKRKCAVYQLAMMVGARMTRKFVYR